MSMGATFQVSGSTQAALHAKAREALARLDPGDGWTYSVDARPIAIDFSGVIGLWEATVRATYRGEETMPPTPAPEAPEPDPRLDSYDTHDGTAESEHDPRLFSHDDRDYVPPPPPNHGRLVGGWGRRKRS